MKCSVERIKGHRNGFIYLFNTGFLLEAGHRGDSMNKSSLISPICGYNSNEVDIKIKITKTQFSKWLRCRYQSCKDNTSKRTLLKDRCPNLIFAKDDNVKTGEFEYSRKIDMK